MAKQRVNIVASIKARLTNIVRAKRMPFDLILIQYALERILYRLSTSTHRDRFVLKGGMLLTTWIPDDARVTRDLTRKISPTLSWRHSTVEKRISPAPYRWD